MHPIRLAGSARPAIRSRGVGVAALALLLAMLLSPTDGAQSEPAGEPDRTVSVKLKLSLLNDFWFAILPTGSR
jgi:hypothetical protein